METSNTIIIIDIVNNGLDFNSTPDRNYVPKLTYTEKKQEVITLKITKPSKERGHQII